MNRPRSEIVVDGQTKDGWSTRARGGNAYRCVSLHREAYTRARGCLDQGCARIGSRGRRACAAAVVTTVTMDPDSQELTNDPGSGKWCFCVPTQPKETQANRGNSVTAHTLFGTTLVLWERSTVALARGGSGVLWKCSLRAGSHVPAVPRKGSSGRRRECLRGSSLLRN